MGYPTGDDCHAFKEAWDRLDIGETKPYMAGSDDFDMAPANLKDECLPGSYGPGDVIELAAILQRERRFHAVQNREKE